jgi:hypothetical protein
MSLGLAAIFVLGIASQAMAHQFTASRLPKPLSETEPGKTSGVGVESETGKGELSQRLIFGNFEIFCAANAKAMTIPEGAVSWSVSQTFSTEVKFTKCLTKVVAKGLNLGLKTKFNVNPVTKKAEPIKIVYHQNGFAEIGTGETTGEVEVGSGEANFVISGKVCKINWPAQTVPVAAIKKPEEEFSSAVYSNKFVLAPEKQQKNFPPNGEQERLLISNDFKKMKWSYEEGQCLGEGGFEEEAKKTEANSGQYAGILEEQVKNGNLGFE